MHRLIWAFAVYICPENTFSVDTVDIVAFTTQRANYADYIQIDDIFSYFLQKICFDISCKLSPLETTCMKCQSILSAKKKPQKNKKKYFKMSSAEIFTQIRRPGLQWDVNSLITIFVENCFP